jgi:beta-phosphoglucomutase-like phosphatase (HAD superfamily)
MINLIVCDIDGVLVDSKKAVFEAYRKAFLLQNVEFTVNHFEDILWNKPWNEELIKSHFEIDIQALRSHKQEFFKETQLRINKGLISFLNNLYSIHHINIDLITGGSEEATEHKLNSMELSYRNLICSAKKRALEFWKTYFESRFMSFHKIWVIDDDFQVLNIIKELGANAIHIDFS